MNTTFNPALRFNIALLLLSLLPLQEGYSHNFSTTPEHKTTAVRWTSEAIPTINSENISTFCSGGSVLLTASAALTYQWYKNEIIVAGANANAYIATSSGSYTVKVSYAGVPEATSAGTVLKQTNTWTGAASTSDWNTPENWSCGALPSASDYVVIPNTDTPPVLGEGDGALAYSLAVSAGVTFTINSGTTITISNALHVDADAIVVLNNNASLVQLDNVANTGNILVKRHTSPITRYDFTYWSSPIAEQTLFDLSPLTLADKYLSFDAVIGNWITHMNGNSIMQTGKGYIVRAPQTFSLTAPAIYTEGQFIGTPNNGTVTVPVTLGASPWNLIGNPYPSAINADVFITAAGNEAIEGTLYFWTHNSAPASYTYASDDYASYNLMGGVVTSSGTGNNEIPTGKIASGQGFFVKAAGTGTVAFDNSMRISGNNYNFYKQANSTTGVTSIVPPSAKSRIWLNLSNNSGAFKQTLLGYSAEATDGSDRNYDGETFNGNSFINLYTIANNHFLAIQGRALPLDTSEIIPLGYSSTSASGFEISLGDFDGLFGTQNIYLLDKTDNSTHNLKTAAYAFTTAAGTFNERFELRFTDSVLGTDGLALANGTIVIGHDKKIRIQSPETIATVVVYDLSGKQLFSETDIASPNFETRDLQLKNQVVMVRIQFENNTVTTKKVSLK